MSMIDDWKGKAAGYLDEVGKKKDELIEKAATFKRVKLTPFQYRSDLENSDSHVRECLL